MQFSHLAALICLLLVVIAMISVDIAQAQALLWSHPSTAFPLNIQAFTAKRNAPTSGRSWTRRRVLESSGSPFQLEPFTSNHNRSGGMRRQLTASTPVLGNQDVVSTDYDDRTHGVCMSKGTNGVEIFPTTGSKVYNLDTQACCTNLKSGVYGAAPVIVSAAVPEEECCYIQVGTSWMTAKYNSTTQICCNGTLHSKVGPNGYDQECCGTTVFEVANVLDDQFSCCGNELSGGSVYNTGTDFCCQGQTSTGGVDYDAPYTVYPKDATYDSCCLGELPYKNGDKECAISATTFTVALV